MLGNGKPGARGVRAGTFSRKHLVNLAGWLAVASFASGPALAAGGKGGGSTGGAGGTGFVGDSGAAGTGSGGGGGGAAGGGTGGVGGNGGGTGGIGDSTPGAAGGNGGAASNGKGGGGGGGGANGNGSGAETISNSDTLTGGAGGNGGNGPTGLFNTGGAGGGGAGGYGAIVTGSGENSNTSTISGGAGGRGGGAASAGLGQPAGNGGDGGVGVQFINPAASIFTNSGSVSGGVGGLGGAGNTAGVPGVGGAGGMGIIGSSLTVNNNGGSIGGGNGGAGGSGTAGGGAGGAAGGGISGSDLTIHNTDGTITGGNGGAGGTGVLPGIGGAAGIAISGSNVLLDNTGTIGGGSGGNGTANGGGAAAGISAAGLSITSNSGTISGGNGGSGGIAGGAAGAGISGTDLSITSNTGTITGGTGGSSSALGGAGGAGISGTGTTINNAGTIAGGAGGNGGIVLGGNGGIGISGSGFNITNTATGSILGGAGGDGDTGDGSGGAGISGSGMTITNSGVIRGGNRTGILLNLAGVGITGSNLTVINNSSISGGLDGATPQSAITFTGGTNSLELQAGSNITGNVVAFGAGDTLKLGGATDSTFDVSSIGAAAQYRNFGQYTKTGTSTWTLTGTTSAVTPWSLDEGTLAIGSDGALGAAGGGLTFNGGTLEATASFTSSDRPVTITAGNDAKFKVDNDVVLTWTSAITGTDVGLQLTGPGTLNLAAASTYTGATSVVSGTLQAGVTGAFSSSSAFALGSTGALDLNGLDQTIGSLAGDGTVTNSANTAATLTTGGDNTSTVFNGIIQDGAHGVVALTKTGTGVMTLNGINTYTGGTNVEAGELALNGSVLGNMQVQAGAALSGIGRIGGNLDVSGNVAPGNSVASIGTLTVGGSFTQGPGSTYTAEVNASGQSDLIKAGSASLLGGMVSVQAQAGTYRRTTNYTIVSTTGATTGTYDGVTSNQVRLVPTLIYGPNGVTLSLFNLDATYNNPNFTPNENAVAYVLNGANATATGDFGNVLNAISNLDPASMAKVLDAISGQVYSGFGSLNLQSIQAFLDSFQFQAGGGQSFGSTAAAPGRNYMALAEDCDVACDVGAAARWGVWGGGVGVFGTVAGDTNAHGLTYNLGGFTGGIDRKFTDNFKAGVATGFTAASLYAQGAPGYGTSNTLQFSLYGEYAQGPVYLDALAGYAHSDNRMNRPIVIAGLPYRAAQGYTTANQFFGQLETGYKIDVVRRIGGFVTPFVRLQGSTSTQNGFTETGADSLNLAVAQQTTNSLRTVLGAQLGAAIDAGWQSKLNVLFRAGWSHEYADLSRPVTASFAGAPALSFTTQGAIAPRDGVVLGLGLDTSIAERTSIYFRYDGDLAGGNTNHILSGGVRFVW